MNQSNSSKQVLLSVIGVAILVVAVVGVSFAFFNYTRTGDVNKVTTGQIIFQSSHSTISLDNAIPASSADLAKAYGTGENQTTRYEEVAITVTGNTTYTEGIDYRISLVDVSNAAGIPITVQAKQSGLTANGSTIVQRDNTTALTGTYATLYSRTGTTADLATKATGGYEICHGHIAYNATAGTGVDGTVTLRIYISDQDVAITDTLVGDDPLIGVDTNDENNYTNGTPTSWVAGRMRFTTAQWNQKSASFKILVEAHQSGAGYLTDLSQGA